MAGENNLIPLDRRTEDEQRKIQSMGGVASGAARRRRKALREALDVYISLPVQDKRSLNRLLRAGVDEDGSVTYFGANDIPEILPGQDADGTVFAYYLTVAGDLCRADLDGATSTVTAAPLPV